MTNNYRSMMRAQACLQAVMNTYLAGVGVLSLPAEPNPWLYPVWFLLVCLAGIASVFRVCWQEAGLDDD